MTLFAFTDIEITGLDPEDDEILEIAWLITDEHFHVLTPPRTFIVEHGDEWGGVFASLKANPVVQTMHEKSGLAADLLAKNGYRMMDIALAFVDDVMQASDGFDSEMFPVHLAGFSVGFDRSFLQKDNDWWGIFESDMHGFQIHHRLLDLSSVKLMLDASGLQWVKAENRGAHRALNDVHESLDQARIFQHILKPVSI